MDEKSNIVLISKLSRALDTATANIGDLTKALRSNEARTSNAIQLLHERIDDMIKSRPVTIEDIAEAADECSRQDALVGVKAYTGEGNLIMGNNLVGQYQALLHLSDINAADNKCKCKKGKIRKKLEGKCYECANALEVLLSNALNFLSRNIMKRHHELCEFVYSAARLKDKESRTKFYLLSSFAMLDSSVYAAPIFKNAKICDNWTFHSIGRDVLSRELKIMTFCQGYDRSTFHEREARVFSNTEVWITKATALHGKQAKDVLPLIWGLDENDEPLCEQDMKRQQMRVRRLTPLIILGIFSMLRLKEAEQWLLEELIKHQC